MSTRGLHSRKTSASGGEERNAIFLWVIWFWILITVFIDLLRSHDLSGWAKALWFIFILLLPLIGVLVYLIARGGKMNEHAVRDTQVQEQQFRSYVQGPRARGRGPPRPAPATTAPPVCEKPSYGQVIIPALC
jgi:hypothetical protein